VQAAIASAFADEFNSWSQQVQDQWEALQGTIQALQTKEAALEGDFLSLSEADRYAHITVIRGLQNTIAQKLAQLRGAGKGGDEAADDLQGIANDDLNYDPYAASGLPPQTAPDTQPDCLDGFMTGGFGCGGDEFDSGGEGDGEGEGDWGDLPFGDFAYQPSCSSAEASLW
jgi:hypothetical protein